MALKFLNKKGWHTGSLRNIENVWKAEQKHDAEKKKLEELKKQIKEEREAQEFRTLQEQAGLAPKQERLDFLYDSGLAVRKTTTDEYLLGKPIEETKESEVAKATEGPGSLFASKPQSANDSWRKLHSDPLLLIRLQEQAALAAIRNNPVKMDIIRKQAQEKLKEKEKEKETNGKKRKHREKKEKRVKEREDNDSDVEDHHVRKNKKSRREEQPRKRGRSDGDISSEEDHHDRRIHERNPGHRGSGKGRDDFSRSDNNLYREGSRRDLVEKSEGFSKGSDDSRRGREEQHRGTEKSNRRQDRNRDYGETRGLMHDEDDSHRVREEWHRGEDRRRQNGGPHSHREDHRHTQNYRREVGGGRNAYDLESHLSSRGQDRKQGNGNASQGASTSTVNGRDVYHQSSREEERKEYHRHKEDNVRDAGDGPKDTVVEPQPATKRGALSEEEKAARLKEMQADAELHEEQRWQRVKKGAEADAREAKQSIYGRGKNFLDDANRNAYGADSNATASVSDSIRRRAHYRDPGAADAQNNAFRR